MMYFPEFHSDVLDVLTTWLISWVTQMQVQVEYTAPFSKGARDDLSNQERWYLGKLEYLHRICCNGKSDVVVL